MPKGKACLLLSAIMFCTMTLTACWDKRELQDLQIPDVVGYDTVLENEKEYPDDIILVSAGWPVTSERAAENYHVEGTPGSLVGETRSRRNAHIGEQLVVGQIQAILFGEDFVRKMNLTEYNDPLSRNTAIKGTIHMAVVKGRAVDILSKKVTQYENSGEYVKSLLENIDKTNFYPQTSMFEYNRDVFSNFTIPILPLIVEKKGDIVAAGSCLLNNGKLAAELGREETQIAVMIRGQECYGIISYDVSEKGKATDKVSFQGANRRKVKVTKTDGKYNINISIMLKGTIIEHDELVPFKDGKDLLKESEKALEELVKNRAEVFVRKTQKEYKFEALNVGRIIQSHTRQKLTQQDINKIIQEAEITVDVKVNIINTGGKM